MEANAPDLNLAILVGLLPVILAFSFIIFVIYRSRRESDFRRRETELKLSKAEGELKALRAQINPHFIFNCLNSIHHFIQAQEPKQASEYLIKFSQLIRYVLESSAKNWVSLEEELEANKIYLDLENLRRQEDFSFIFQIEDGISPGNYFIPPMLIQPFLENAVWHGVNANGIIQLHISKNGSNHLHFLISDNGIEKSEKSEIDLSRMVKKSSMGLQLMEEKFKNLNELRGTQASFDINPQAGVGTQVRLIIPFEEE
ncbi:sensor histidine kinase [Algoriphagus sp.]|uniref:sensor histidine kinase n=1 Tax=Algoriphagus sp. TaxID=1872435 RepID=UPI003919A23D